MCSSATARKNFMNKHYIIVLTTLLWVTAARADGLTDNMPDKVRRVPPPGIAIPETDRTELTAGVTKLGKEIDSLRTELKFRPTMLELLPDVQIFHNAVRYALAYDEFLNTLNWPLGAAVAVLLLLALVLIVVGASRLVERRYAQVFG